MRAKIKYIAIGILISVIAFPAIAMGGSFTVSLIQGKNVGEAIHVLAEQIDSLLVRLEIIESKQTEIESEQIEQVKQLACLEAEQVRDKILNGSVSGIIDVDIKSIDEMIDKVKEEIIKTTDLGLQEQTNLWQDRLSKLEDFKIQYISKKAECDNL